MSSTFLEEVSTLWLPLGNLQPHTLQCLTFLLWPAYKFFVIFKTFIFYQQMAFVPKNNLFYYLSAISVYDTLLLLWALLFRCLTQTKLRMWNTNECQNSSKLRVNVPYFLLLCTVKINFYNFNLLVLFLLNSSTGAKNNVFINNSLYMIYCRYILNTLNNKIKCKVSHTTILCFLKTFK